MIALLWLQRLSRLNRPSLSPSTRHAMQAADLPPTAPANRGEAAALNSYAALSKLSNIPATTLWRRAQGKPSRKDKAASQQYLTPPEEKALLHYVLRAYENGRPFPHSSTPCICTGDRSSATFDLPDSRSRPCQIRCHLTVLCRRR